MRELLRRLGRLADRGRVVIWSSEHGAFWGPDGRGYFTCSCSAGRYTRADAIRRAGGCGPEKLIQVRPATDPHRPTPFLWDELHPDREGVRAMQRRRDAEVRAVLRESERG